MRGGKFRPSFLRHATLLPPRNRRVQARTSAGYRFFTWGWFFFVLVSVGAIIVTGYVTVVFGEHMFPPDRIEARYKPVASVLRDRMGRVFGQLGRQQSEYLSLQEIREKNPLLLRMLERVEDHRFRRHHGVDFQGVLRAVWKNVQVLDRQEGAGTITMQTCRNIVLQDHRKSLSRKFKEIVCALNLERRYSKDTILEAYANYISYGFTIYGLPMAAKIYFGVDLAKQTLRPEQAAMLAGMPKGPNQYNPIRHPQQALQRRNQVLEMMAQGDEDDPPILTQPQVRELQKRGLGVYSEAERFLLIRAGREAFRDVVENEIRQRYGLDPDRIIGQGYQVYTSMDPKAQEVTEQVLRNDKFFRDVQGRPLPLVDAGMVLLEPRTGHILAVGGGASFPVWIEKPCFGTGTCRFSYQATDRFHPSHSGGGV
ncbi:transglycosylase domain-containing protein [Pasteuria penetrans]|uniref:transglycosylase domain-containing protein n=1 Tax=Pasteuria penetrans TaxID=86005 RepID=UPI000F98E277|nr:transglycosylase domain-containing protein [Pasteuria penetrans]